jgi:hypothetical protein
MIFCNLFNARSHAQRLRELVIQGLFDEQYEVRIAASMTLSGFYQCGYIQVTNEDLVGLNFFFFSLKSDFIYLLSKNHFRVMSHTNYFTNIDGKKVTLPTNVVKRHGG